jgi:hypothetical protein
MGFINPSELCDLFTPPSEFVKDEESFDDLVEARGEEKFFDTLPTSVSCYDGGPLFFFVCFRGKDVTHTFSLINENGRVSIISFNEAIPNNSFFIYNFPRLRIFALLRSMDKIGSGDRWSTEIRRIIHSYSSYCRTSPLVEVTVVRGGGGGHLVAVLNEKRVRVDATHDPLKEVWVVEEAICVEDDCDDLHTRPSCRTKRRYKDIPLLDFQKMLEEIKTPGFHKTAQEGWLDIISKKLLNSILGLYIYSWDTPPGKREKVRSHLAC